MYRAYKSVKQILNKENDFQNFEVYVTLKTKLEEKNLFTGKIQAQSMTYLGTICNSIYIEITSMTRVAWKQFGCSYTLESPDLRGTRKVLSRSTISFKRMEVTMRW
jgi:hypothetical protein